jgi:HSP20 family protein
MNIKPERRLIPWGFFERPVFESLMTDMERMLDEFGFRRGLVRPGVLPVKGQEYTWVPDVEVITEHNELLVRADLPGIDPKDVNVEVTEEALIIRGERKKEFEEKKGGYYRSERVYGHFYRAIPLPEGAIGEGAKATFVKGVLEIRLPVPPRPEPKTRKVLIETAPEKLLKEKVGV